MRSIGLYILAFVGLVLSSCGTAGYTNSIYYRTSAEVYDNSELQNQTLTAISQDTVTADVYAVADEDSYEYRLRRFDNPTYTVTVTTDPYWDLTWYTGWTYGTWRWTWRYSWNYGWSWGWDIYPYYYSWRHYYPWHSWRYSWYSWRDPWYHRPYYTYHHRDFRPNHRDWRYTRRGGINDPRRPSPRVGTPRVDKGRPSGSSYRRPSVSNSRRPGSSNAGNPGRRPSAVTRSKPNQGTVSRRPEARPSSNQRPSSARPVSKPKTNVRYNTTRTRPNNQVDRTGYGKSTTSTVRRSGTDYSRTSHQQSRPSERYTPQRSNTGYSGNRNHSSSGSSTRRK